jgi:beta-mannosidase
MQLLSYLSYLSVSPLLAAAVCQAAVWQVRLEEPTGIYRRAGEVVRVPLEKLGGAREGFRVLDPAGAEAPWQVARGALLFPAAVTPGQTPVYRVTCCTPEAARFENQITARRLGRRRLELANTRFRVVIDADLPAIVEAYSLTAGPQRSLNLVETTPEKPDKNDIHQAKPEAPPAIGGENTGWTSLGAAGPIERIEILSDGPVEAHVRLSGAGESWDLRFTAGSPWLRWEATRGFRFASVSALPYLPFDRAVDGGEYRWPSGPGSGEPPNHEIVPRPWKQPPGGHFVYYQRAENYGALGIVALDPQLDWTGAGSRKFEARKVEGRTVVALTFPLWKGDDTVLEARREARCLREPLLVEVAASEEAQPLVVQAARREPETRIESGAFPPVAFAQRALPLDGEWELAWGEKGAGPSSEWRRVRVPGSVHTSWLTPDKIYSPEALWLSGKEWWYRRQVEVPAAFAGANLQLEFEATDYYAEIFVDGRRIGRHEGYIDPHRHDVTGVLRPGARHELRVRVWTPVSYYWRHRPYTVKGSYGAVDQKPDDITALGITRGVRLAAYGAARVSEVAVATRLAERGGEVELTLEAAGEPGEYTWEATLRPRNFTGGQSYRARVPLVAARQRLTLAVPDAALWWTWDHGKPNLYTLEVALKDAAGTLLDTRSLAVGIREIEKSGWRFYLNRRPLFIRGTNYYYNLFLSEVNREQYARDMDLMLGMNVNMIRLHCHFTNREFYELADERGVLLWQDYLEAWYPRDRDFSLHASALYDNHIRYVRNHPSVALWATSDEEDLENYRDLTKHLAARPALLDPQQRPVVRSTGRYGDAHLYHGWYGGTIWEYTRMDEPFVSELGATTLPARQSLEKFLAGKWPIREHEADWRYHKLQIEEAFANWGEPGALSYDEYIARTQAYGSRLFQLSLERMRRRKADGAGGILHFHAIDIWPSVTMAAIDFYRVPTAVYDTVRRSFEPVAASVEYDRAVWKRGEQLRLPLWALNDRWTALEGATIEWRIEDAQGQPRGQGKVAAAMAPDSAREVGVVEWLAAAPGEYRLRATVRDAAGKPVAENLYSLRVSD